MKLQRRTMAILAVVAAICAVIGVPVAVRVEQALRGAEHGLLASHEIPVTVRALAPQPNPGFEGLSAPAVFTGGAELEGHFYLSGPAGLFAYSMDGSLQHIYRSGLEAPAAPLGKMAVGTLTDSRQPELLIAARGEGVLAFDGQGFREIRPDEKEARQVTALLPLTSGRLLLGTAKLGLLVFDGKTLKSFHPTTDTVSITAIAGNESELWVGTQEGGVLHWRGGQAERIGEAEGLPDAHVNSIALGGDSTFVGTPLGVAEIRQGKVVRALAAGRYAHALMAEDGGLLVGQMEGGVLRVALGPEAGGATPRRPIGMHAGEAGTGKNEAQNDTVEQFLKAGAARYAVAGDGLLREEPGGEWRKVLGGAESLLTDRNISALMAASDGRLWVGYFDRGLDILPAAGGPPQHVETEQVFCVNRIVENPRAGEVAVATANGLVLFDRQGRQKQVLTRDGGLIASHVTDVALYGDGMVVATPAGITFLDSSGSHSMYAFQGLVNNHVYALGVKDSRLLVGTLGGLSLVGDGAVRRNWTTSTSGLKHNWITALVAAGGDWLVGTYGQGVMRMDANGAVTPTDATRDNVVINPGAMADDGRLVLAGTLGQGLLVGDATGTRWKTVTAGLPSLNVTALSIDHGVVYVGTENGLVKIAEDKL